MTSMAQTTDTDRWTPGDADRRIADELDRAGVRVGGGRRRTDWTLPAYDEPIGYSSSVREWLGETA